MPSSYFKKTGVKNPSRKYSVSCMPLPPLSDAKIDKMEVELSWQPLLAAGGDWLEPTIDLWMQDIESEEATADPRTCEKRPHRRFFFFAILPR